MNKMITVANFGTLMEAELLKLKLASFGIEAFIPDELTAGVAPHIFATKSGVRVQVSPKDADQAKEVMTGVSDILEGGEASDSQEAFHPEA
jgi:hypothetical protein